MMTRQDTINLSVKLSKAYGDLIDTCQMEINIRETQRKTRMDNPDEQSTVGTRHRKRRQNRK
jgi:hypothetical protein